MGLTREEETPGVLRRSPSAIERGSRALTRLLGLVPVLGLRCHLDLPVAKTDGGRELRMHLLRPKRAERPLPCVAYVFGGSWRSGNIDQGLAGMALLAARGYVTACIDYRLSSEATFPAQLEDCRTAVRFLRSNAGAWGIDAGRVGVVGLSAGGHLAALLGLSADEGSSAMEGACDASLQAVVTWCAPTDLLALSCWHGDADSPDTAQAALLGGPPSQQMRLVEQANPVNHVSPASPPFLLLHGAEDRLVPPQQSQLLHEALLSAGAQSRLEVLPGEGHGFLGVQALRLTASFLDTHLKAPARC